MRKRPVEYEKNCDSSYSDSVKPNRCGILTPGKRTRDFENISLEGKLESPAKKRKSKIEHGGAGQMPKLKNVP